MPLVGRILFGEDPLRLLSRSRWSSASGCSSTARRAGLVLRAVGDNHASAHALGYPVIGIRMLAVLFGGACAGLGGAFLSLAYTPFFIPGMTAGRGWIALALVVFASWRPLRLVVGAYLFGAVSILQLHTQALGLRRAPAVDVGPALSCHRDRSRVDFTDARYCRVRCACVLGCSLRA